MRREDTHDALPAVLGPLFAASPGSMTDFGARLCRSAPAAHGEFLLSSLLMAPGRQLTLPLANKHGRQLPGCVAVLSAEELPNTNAVVSWSLGREGRRGLAGEALHGSPLTHASPAILTPACIHPTWPPRGPPCRSS